MLYGIGTDFTLYCESPELSAPPSDPYPYSQPPVDEYNDYPHPSNPAVAPEYLPMSKPPAPMFYNRSMPGLYSRPTQYMMNPYYGQPYMNVNGNSHSALNGFADHGSK